METETFDGAKERKVLASIIYFDDVMARIAGLADRVGDDLLYGDMACYILRWCLEFYRKEGKAPGGHFADVIGVARSVNESFAKKVEIYARTLPILTSSNSHYLTGVAVEYIEWVRLRKLVDKLSMRLNQENTRECQNLITGFTELPSVSSDGVDPITDSDAMKAVFEDTTNQCILNFMLSDEETAREAKEFFGDTFSRSSFVVINAAEKSGKSALLIELALQAVREGRNVAYFEAGDMSQIQVFRRMYQRLASLPRRSGVQYKVPTGPFRSVEEFWELQDKDGGGALTLEATRRVCGELAEQACTEIKKRLGDVGPVEITPGLRFSAHSQDLSVPQIQSILEGWQKVDGFVPDFIIIDYADLLIPATKNQEYRHQINDTFGRLRALSLSWKCCLLTATQARGASWGADVQTREFLAEDKRKAAHPTAILGLSANAHERDHQVAKLNFIIRRDDVCNERDALYLGQCLAICQPMMRAWYTNGMEHDSVQEDNSQSVGGSSRAGQGTSTASQDDEYTGPPRSRRRQDRETEDRWGLNAYGDVSDEF